MLYTESTKPDRRYLNKVGQLDEWMLNTHPRELTQIVHGHILDYS